MPDAGRAKSDTETPALRERFGDRYRFGFDRFQLEAFDAIDRSEHTVVAAPTGSGKTVVAEYAIESTIDRRQRSFYTTPIKALSNQKYRDLVDRYGPQRVGLLTGDHSINADAAVVVMTTEVLRNMIYGDNRLDDLGLVVIDEVHFLQDTYRGPVWEEVIIGLPETVQLVCLSATVSNSDELAAWIETVRGPSRAVVEARRPVPLEQVFLVDDLGSGAVRSFPTLVKGAPNPKVEGFLARRGIDRSNGRGRRRPRSSLATPDRFEVLDYLRTHELLPAIHFVFSRRQCSDAAQACVAAGLRLSDDTERERMVSLVENRVIDLSDADLRAVGYSDFVEQVSCGVAPHHAGLIPAFREVVELGFLAGLIKLVYATETLAVGVNMPARTVVIDKLTKYNGEHHEMLSPAQFTQLSGRAGRRGMDTSGSVVVLWSPFVRFDAVAELAASDGFALRSAFRPTYNMAANLIARYDEARARQFLSLSFAQYQADRHVVRLERQIARLQRRLAEQSAASDGTGRSGTSGASRPPRDEHGDDELGDDEHADAQHGDDEHGDDALETALGSLRPGDVVAVDKGTFRGPAAVVATSQRAAGTKVSVITPTESVLKLAPQDWKSVPTVLTRIVLPGAFSPHQRHYRVEVARRIKAATLGSPAAAVPTRRRRAERAADRERARDAAERTVAEIDRLSKRVDRRDGALTAEFERVLVVLAELGFVDRTAWKLTESGEMLAKVFHENDLLICRAIRDGVFDGLDAPAVAGLASVFVYEHRSPDDPPPPWFPSEAVAERFGKILSLSDEQARFERAANRPVHRRPDPTLFGAVFGWVSGGGLELVLDDQMTGGDFVRSIRQLSDLLEQIATVAAESSTRSAARRAAASAYRDVVADSATELVGERR